MGAGGRASTGLAVGFCAHLRTLKHIRPWWSAAFVSALLLASSAAAEQRHTVRSGQNLARIAKRYGVSVGQLLAANQMRRTDPLREGQVIRVPERGVVYVRSGDTLARIAKRHGVGVGELTRQNRIKPTANLRIGQRLILPGFEAAEELVKAEQRWGKPRRPGTATFYRIRSDEKQRVRLVDDRGRVRRPALRQLKRLLRPLHSRKRKEPHPRLVRLLAQVSDHFGGRPIDVVSGYRLAAGYTTDSSRHVAGHAVDFRVRGVPLEVLRDYCARFDHTGVGYYPRSRFVHLDVRRKNARWTDWSRPGEPPRRRPPGDAAPAPSTEAALSDEPEAEDDGEPPIDDDPGALSDD